MLPMSKIAVVTGGAGLIGTAICRAFQSQGYTVVAADLVEATCCDLFFPLDLTDEGDIVTLFEETVNAFGAVHILVNCGAIARVTTPILETSGLEFDQVLSTNLRGSYLCCREFVRWNQGQNYGRIVNIASTRFHQNEANWELYGMSKGGLVSLTNSLCVSLSGTPITVNAISPGWIADEAEAFTPADLAQHPSGRVGKPQDIANACLFFCQEGNDFINGANLMVDGGMTKKMIYEE